MNNSPLSRASDASTSEAATNGRRKTLARVIALVVLAVALGVAISLILSKKSMQAGPVADQNQFAAAEQNAKLNMVLEIQRVTPTADGGSLEARILKVEYQDSYLRTAQTIPVEWRGPTKLVMGGLTDLKKGGVIQVAGKKDGQALDASQIVILTGYVVVK